jgi:hypothetical protein
MTFEEMEEAIALVPSVQKLLELVDSDLFNPDYLKDGPWVRIELQPVYCTQRDRTFAIDVWLVLHTSGSAVMTFVVRHESDFAPSELARVSSAGSFLFDETELSSWVVETSASLHDGWNVIKPDATRFSSGISWARWKHDEPASLADVFSLYQDAVLTALSARRPAKSAGGQPYSTQWRCYPVACVRDADPRVFDLCDDDAQAQIGALVARVGSGRDFRRAMLLEEAGRDLSITNGQRSWVNRAHALTIVSPARRKSMAQRYGGVNEIPGQDWIWLEQQFAVPFDFLLLRAHTAHALSAQVQNLPLKPESLHDLKARVLAAKLSFQRASTFSYDTLHPMADAFDGEGKTQEAWSLVDDALDLVGGVLETEERAAAARRAFALQSVLGLVAVVLGIPAAHRIVEVLGGVDQQGAGAWFGFGRFVDTTVSAARDSPGPLVVGLVLALIGLVALALWSGRRRIRRQRNPLITRAMGALPRSKPFQYFEPNQTIRVVRRNTDEPAEDRTD